MKKLKKVWMLALLAVGFAMVIGCSNGSSDDDTKEPTPNPTENPTDPGDKTPETEPDGVVEIDGEKYYRVTPNEYDTFIEITEVDLSGKTTIKCTVFGKEENADAQAVVQLLDADWNGITPTLEPIAAAPTPVQAEVGDKVKKVVRIQPFTQSTSDWSALSDVTIYIGKITAEGGNGDPFDVFDPAKYNGAE